MAKVKVTVKFDIINELKLFFNPDVTRKVGKTTIKEMKKMITRGVSPIKGRGRFPAYAIQRGTLREKRQGIPPGSGYPDGIDGKNRRPINLTLSGDMLDALSFKEINNKSIDVGFLRGTSQDILDRAKTHQKGDSTRNIPQRRFIPAAEGEDFKITIRRAINKIFENRLSKLIQRSNKKGRRKK